MKITATASITAPFTVDELVEYVDHLRGGRRTGMITTSVGDDGVITLTHTTSYPDDVNRP